MKRMSKWSLVLLAVLSFTAAAGAQEYPSEPYEFITAKLAAGEGRYDEALSLLDKVVAKNPADPVLLYERALMLMEAGRLERAESELQSVVKTNPDFYDAQRSLGRLLLDRAGADRSRVDEALVHLQAAFRLNPDDLSTGMAVSQIHMSLGKMAEAERVLATLVERAPDQRSINYSYAQVLTKIGRGSESQKYLERAVTLDPTFGPAILQLIDIYQQQGEWIKAAAVLQALVTEDPLNAELQRQQAYFYLRGGESEKARDTFRILTKADPKDERSLFYLAESLNDLEQYVEADKIFRQLLAATPSDPDYLASFGLSQIGQRNWSEARKVFTTLLELPEAPENLTALARTQLAFVELQEGNYAAAVEKARPAFVFRDRPNAQAINIALDALKRENKNEEALALLQPLVAQHGNDPFLNARYIEWLLRAGQKEKAQQLAATQAKLGGRNTIAASEAYVQAEQFPAAIALMRAAVKATPNDVELQFSLGSLLERAGEKKAAEQTFLSILEKNPEHGPSLNYLGYMWAESNVNLERAQEMLTRAVGQEPQNGAYVDSLGWVYYRMGNLELAEKYLTDAVRLMPRDATVREHLADVVAKRGDMSRALEIYRQALKLEPTEKESEQIRSKIAALERKGQTSER